MLFSETRITLSSTRGKCSLKIIIQRLHLLQAEHFLSLLQKSFGQGCVNRKVSIDHHKGRRLSDCRINDKRNNEATIRLSAFDLGYKIKQAENNEWNTVSVCIYLCECDFGQ